MLQKLLAYIKKLYAFSPKLFLANLFFLVATGLFSNVGLLVLLPILSVLDEIEGVPEGIGQHVQGFFDWFEVQPTLPICLGLFLAIVTANTFLNFFQTVASSRLNTGFISKMRVEVFSQVTLASYQFHLEKSRSSLVHVLTQEIQRVGSLTHFFLRQLSSFILAGSYFVFSFLVSAPLTLLATAVGAFFYGVLRFQNTAASEVGQANYNLSQHLFHVVTDSLAAIDITKIFMGESRHIRELQTCSEEMVSRQQDFQLLQAKNQVLHKLGGAAFLALYFYGSQLLSMPMANTLLLLVLFSRLFPLASQLQQNYQNILQTLPAFAEVMRLMDQAKENREPLATSPGKAIGFDGPLSLASVTFSYPGKREAALREINMELKENETTALIGPSGGGKSTLSKVLIGLLRPQRGRFSMGGKRIPAEKMLAFRESVSYVPQDDFLFNDSVRNNLLWANMSATDLELQDAIEMSAAGFVYGLKSGLDTVVGDRGVKLSGGERQRIAIARALLKKPKLLVLDEATSFLDSANEAWFQSSLQKLKGRLTILVIAHRLNTIRHADSIYVLENGRIIDRGSWGELHEPGRYLSTGRPPKLEQIDSISSPLWHGPSTCPA